MVTDINVMWDALELWQRSKKNEALNPKNKTECGIFVVS